MFRYTPQGLLMLRVRPKAFDMDYYISIIATLVAAIAVLIARQQYFLAKGKLKLDLFEKRFAVYKGVQVFLSIIFRDAKYELPQLYAFRRDTQDASFLFGSEIPDYIKNIDKMALDLRSCARKRKDLPKGEERSKLAEEERQLLEQLTGELPKLQEVFSAYLSFAKWK